MTFYYFDYDDGEYWTTVDLVKGETQLSFYRAKSMNSTEDFIDEMKQRANDKKKKNESK